MRPTMTTSLPPVLQSRLQRLAEALAVRRDALGLLALGSVGQETARADAWSDLDFFVIVRPGAKPQYLADLGWLAAAHPLEWAFANTADGYKALMADGLLCEFAVFEPQELHTVAYAPGRWAWRRPGELAEALACPQRTGPVPNTRDWLVGEALSNLLVGLQRFRRGERLAAMRMVQVYALDRLLELIDHLQTPVVGVARDPFSADRRFEQRHPAERAMLRQCAGGIDATPQAALALLARLEELVPLPAGVVARIRSL